MKIGDLGEEKLLEKLCADLPLSDSVLVGAGDDCAVVKRGSHFELLKTDAVVEGIHFLAEEEARRVGWKAAARVISDFAAMGGRPAELLVTLALPSEADLSWVEDLYEGLKRCAETYGASIVGGETSSVPAGSAKVISVSGTGFAQRYLRRSGGKAGDLLYVTGRLGGSLSGWHLDFTPRVEEAAWLVGNFSPTAMMDLSDGLARDLPRLAKASGCGFEIGNVPCNQGCEVEQAIGDGEDYELLFSHPENEKLEAAWREKFPKLPLTCIGKLTAGGEINLPGGWQHFSGCSFKLLR